MSFFQELFQFSSLLLNFCFVYVRTTTEEERNDKYHRLLAASLQALSMFLSALTDDQREEIADQLHPLLKNAKFWKFGKHSVGMVGLCHMLFNVMLKFDLCCCFYYYRPHWQGG